jgi:hypothetical protein
VRLSSFIVAGIAIATAACSKAESSADTTAVDTAAQAAATATPAPSQPTSTNSAPVTVEDIDRWVRGMAAELKAVQDAGAKLKAAKNANDTLSATMAANDMSTRDAGAAAAGLDPERYQFVRTTLSSAVGKLSPIEMEMNVKEMPPEMIAQMQQSREESLKQMSNDVPPAVIEALRPRAAELRKQDMTLTGERLKASGAA